MKKILLLIAVAGLLMGTVSCGDDDDRPVRTVFTVNTPMINHMVNVDGESVIGIASTYNKLTIDTVKHTASLDLTYNDGTEHTLYLKDITATPKRLRFYELSAPATDQIKEFSGYVDFNEGGSMRYHYVTDNGIRVISTMPEVFFLKTHNTITYDDTTAASISDNTMYEFNITPANMTATIKVMQIVHAKDLKNFNYIIANNVPITVTPNGYTISATDLKTNAEYIFYNDSTGSSVKKTNNYPFKVFNAVIDLANDRLEATYMIGGSATVVATGKTYPDYTAY